MPVRPAVRYAKARLLGEAEPESKRRTQFGCLGGPGGGPTSSPFRAGRAVPQLGGAPARCPPPPRPPDAPGPAPTRNGQSCPRVENRAPATIGPKMRAIEPDAM